MSVYPVHELLWLTEEDPAFRSDLQSDPEGTLREFTLTPKGADALRTGNVGALYRMGVTSFIMHILPMHGLFGITPEAYRAQIRQEEPLRNVSLRG